MTADPLTAVLDQLAACRGQLAQLDDREAAHFAAVGERLTQLADLITTLGRTLADDTAALARLEALDRQVAELADRLAGKDADGKDRRQPGPAPTWQSLALAERKPAIAGLRAWVDQVYRPGYGHLAATLGPCWPAHDLCLYGLDILSQLWRALYLQPARSTSLLSAQAEYQARILPALAAQLMTETAGCAHAPAARRLYLEHAMTNPALRQALAYADRGWPVFPCLPGQKIPATRHGYQDATTDPQQITAWFARHGGWNLAIATGAPGPDVLDVDQHGPAGNGFAAFARLRAAGLLTGASGYVRTPSGGLHAYFTGSAQRNGHLPTQHLDFRSAGGYVLAPPSQVRGRPYQRIRTLDGQAGLDWQAVIRLLEPERAYQQPATRPLPGYGHTRLVRWVAAQREGNRNAGLFWAANRALDADPAADLNELAAAARQAGLPEQEITRTLNSARRTRHAAPTDPGRQAEGPADMNPRPHPPIAPAAAASSNPGDIRDQIRRLQDDGGSYRAIAAAAGLSPATVHGLRSGRRQPTPATERALSTVSSSTLRRARIDAGGSRLRLRALHVMGHGSARIARALGVREMTIRRLVRGDTPTVSARLRDAITDLYDAWWDKRAPERTRFERSAATAARRKAIAGNWCAGAGLDDDELDTPGYRPASGWKPATGTGIAPDIHPPARPRQRRKNT